MNPALKKSLVIAFLSVNAASSIDAGIAAYHNEEVDHGVRTGEYDDRYRQACPPLLTQAGWALYERYPDLSEKTGIVSYTRIIGLFTFIGSASGIIAGGAVHHMLTPKPRFDDRMVR